MSDERNPLFWTRLRSLGLNIAAVGIGGGAATNLADDLPLSVLGAFTVLVAIGCGLVLAACRYGGQPLPRLWSPLPRSRE